MSAKLSALLFTFGLIAVTHGLANERTEVDEEISIDEGIPIDVAILVQERISIDQILTDAKKDVEKLRSFIASVSDKIEMGAASVIRKAYSAFDKAAAQRLQHAGAVGSYVSKCIDKLKDSVNADVEARLKGVGGCITTEVNSALDDVQTLLDAAQSAERDIGAARAKLSDCGKIKNVFQKVKCVAQETAIVTAQVISLSVKVAGAVANAIELYSTFPVDVSSCEMSQLKLAQQDALSMIPQLGDC